jgi:hypothetical protein
MRTAMMCGGYKVTFRDGNVLLRMEWTFFSVMKYRCP